MKAATLGERKNDCPMSAVVLCRVRCGGGTGATSMTIEGHDAWLGCGAGVSGRAWRQEILCPLYETISGEKLAPHNVKARVEATM